MERTACTIARRDFLLTLAKGVIAVGLLDLNSFAGQRRSAVVISNVTIDLTDPANSALTVVGGSQYVSIAQDPNYPLIVIRVSSTAVSAFSSDCTHKGGVVDLPVNGICTCPLHNSEFDQHGNVIQGPATKNLQQFAATLSGNTITITNPPAGVTMGAPVATGPMLLVTYRQSARILDLVFPDRSVSYKISLFDLSGRVLEEISVHKAARFSMQLPVHVKGTCLLRVTSDRQTFAYHFTAF